MASPSPVHIKVLALSILFACAASADLQGQSNSIFENYTEQLSSAEQRVFNTIESLHTTRRARAVTLDISGLSGSSIHANLFSDYSIDLKKHRVPKVGTLHAWCGKEPNSTASGAFIINQNRISGYITSTQGSYEIIPLNDTGLHAVIEHDNREYGRCGNQSEPAPYIQESEPEQNENSEKTITPIQRSVNQSECVVRLLVGYTPAAKENTMSLYNRTMVEHISLAVLLMNQSYVNSLVDQRVELAHLYEVSDEETESSTTDVNDLRDSTDGRWDDIHIRRDQYSADLVALVTGGLYSGECGRAYGFDYDEESEMFQVTEYDCAVSNLTLSHEFGHLQGCRHEIDGNTSPFPYGHGFAQGGYYRTIMAVCCGEERINYWSNPYIYYDGIGSMGTLNFNNNALALNNSYPTVADHRMNPDSIDSEEMLATDHAITGTTMGTIFSSDTTMANGCLILQSESRITLSEGFKSYPGAMGTFKIIDGCSGGTDRTSISPIKPIQRDGTPVSSENETSAVAGSRRDRSQ